MNKTIGKDDHIFFAVVEMVSTPPPSYSSFVLRCLLYLFPSVVVPSVF
jgi:hypothetical protein